MSDYELDLVAIAREMTEGVFMISWDEYPAWLQEDLTKAAESLIAWIERDDSSPQAPLGATESGLSRTDRADVGPNTTDVISGPQNGDLGKA